MARGHLAWLLLAAVTVAIPVPFRAAPPDALIAVRLALGGDAALAQVTSIQASGKIALDNGSRDGTFEVYFEAPDRFVRTTRVAQTLPTSEYRGRLVDRRPLADQDLTSRALDMPDLTTDYSVTTRRVGFRGNHALKSDGGTSPHESMLGGGDRQYARFAIPLLVQLTASYHAIVTSAAGNVQFTGDDGSTWVLTIDSSTHLPATLTWTPVLRSSTSTTPVVMTFDDYRRAGAVTWPYHMITRLSGVVIEDVHVKTYEINRKINEKVFR